MKNKGSPKGFQKRLLTWFQGNARLDLPWRKTRDPYSIWVSEAMLQQTQVVTVIPYYHRFLKKFPTVKALAKAPLSDVLDCWSGLGYYSRARNLHAAAQRVVQEHAGRIPKEVDQLLKLPGVGRYTAGAVASIAYDRPAPILDGNVIRVLSRHFGIQEDPRRPSIRKVLWELSATLVPKGSPGQFNQALMELGALVCTPRAPNCPVCPLSLSCRAFSRGIQEEIPPRRIGLRKKRIRYVCGIIERKRSILLARRPFSGLLAGLWEFPGGEVGSRESGRESLTRHLRQRLGVHLKPDGFLAIQKQTLTHRKLEIRAFRCPWNGGSLRPRWYHETRWFPKKELKEIPFTAGMSRLAQRLCLGICVALLVTGCATVGPRVDKEELKSARQFYEVKAKRYTYTQLVRVRTVGDRLLAGVPEELRPRNPKPSIGVLLDTLTLTTGRVFGIPGIEPDPRSKETWQRAPWKYKKACLIVGVIPSSPATKAGLQPGDLLIQVDKRATRNPKEAVQAFHRVKPGDSIILLLEREGVTFKRGLQVGAKPYPVNFFISEDEEVNAFAQPGEIVVTTGLLRFIASDDELAVVMGHELAHLTRGHIAKGMLPNILAGLIGNIAGNAVDIVIPGAGGVISEATSAGIRAPFSQDFEREADYIGLRYVQQAGYQMEAGLTFWDRFATELPKSLSESFFNTHPTSPERILRLKKTIEELKGQPKP